LRCSKSAEPPPEIKTNKRSSGPTDSRYWRSL